MNTFASQARLLTPQGRGGVATIGYRGPGELLQSPGGFAGIGRSLPADLPVDRVVFGRWGTEPGEEVVLCRVADNQFELHCHGGVAAVGRILADLSARGVRLSTDADLPNDASECPFDRELHTALIRAATGRAARWIAHQATGSLRHELAALANLDSSAAISAGVDRIDAILRWSRFGTHLTQPWRVLLFGEPNVGKSSLLNALTGFDRAIVFDQPGTTRDALAVEIAIDGWPVRLTDTAGLRSDAQPLEALGIDRAKALLASADLRVLVLDASRFAGDPGSLAEQADLIVLNKCDLPHQAVSVEQSDWQCVSAKAGTGLGELQAAVLSRLLGDLPGPSDAVPVSVRQIEMLQNAREALLAEKWIEFQELLHEIAPRDAHR